MFLSHLIRLGRTAFAAVLLLPGLLLAVDPPGAPRTPESAVNPVNRHPNRHAQFLARLKEGPVDLLFLGDSITDFWPHQGVDTWAKFAPYHPALVRRDAAHPGRDVEVAEFRVHPDYISHVSGCRAGASPSGKWVRGS